MPFSKEQAERICKLISEEGLTLRQVAAKEHISDSLIIKYANADAEFGKQYARALETRTDAEFEALSELSQRALSSAITSTDPKIASAIVNAIRLEVDTQKWILSKRNPKKFGDRQDVNLTADISIAETVREMRQRLDNKEPE